MVLTLMKNIWCSTRTGLFLRYVHFPPVSQASLGVIIIQLLRSFYTSVFLFYDGQYLLKNLLHCPLDFGVKPQIS